MSRRLVDRPEIAAHEVVTRAMHRARSDDFGGSAWIEALEVLTRSLDREAHLTFAGRRRSRADLVDRLVARRIEPVTAAPRPVVIVTAPDAGSIAAIEAALGSPVGRGAALMESAFTSSTFELRWHLPSYAEWLAEADLALAYSDVAERSAHLPDSSPVAVVGAVEFGERRGDVAAAFPGAIIVAIDGDVDEAATATAAASTAARRRDSDDIDPHKVDRYWRWRLGLRAERLAAAPQPDLSVDQAELLSAPDVVASRVFAAAGVSPPR